MKCVWLLMSIQVESCSKFLNLVLYQNDATVTSHSNNCCYKGNNLSPPTYYIPPLSVDHKGLIPQQGRPEPQGLWIWETLHQSKRKIYFRTLKTTSIVWHVYLYDRSITYYSLLVKKLLMGMFLAFKFGIWYFKYVVDIISC